MKKNGEFWLLGRQLNTGSCPTVADNPSIVFGQPLSSETNRKKPFITLACRPLFEPLSVFPTVHYRGKQWPVRKGGQLVTGLCWISSNFILHKCPHILYTLYNVIFKQMYNQKYNTIHKNMTIYSCQKVPLECMLIPI